MTGTLIRSSDKTGYNQVQTITAKDITDSGYTNVADYLRSISANSGSSFDQTFTDTFAPGASGLALHGLSEKYTLVLIDGLRVTPYAFAVNGTDTFFDLNTLPLNAIERIEIVKTGAVSQYGSDAIGGVVNIITKKNQHGLTLDASYGLATDGGGGTTKFSASGGFGDLNADHYNFTGALSYYKDNGFTAADRDQTQNMDFRNQPGGLLQQPQSFFLADRRRQPGDRDMPQRRPRGAVLAGIAGRIGHDLRGQCGVAGLAPAFERTPERQARRPLQDQRQHPGVRRLVDQPQRHEQQRRAGGVQ
ncbi:MAG: TonB-dependent receptor plug domain-containing protein [Pararobbsia sp.]